VSHIYRGCLKTVLGRIFGPKRKEVTGGWRRLLNKELHNFYASANSILEIKSKMMGCMGHVMSMGEMRNAYRILVRKI